MSTPCEWSRAKDNIHDSDAKLQVGKGIKGDGIFPNCSADREMLTSVLVIEVVLVRDVSSASIMI